MGAEIQHCDDSSAKMKFDPICDLSPHPLIACLPGGSYTCHLIMFRKNNNIAVLKSVNCMVIILIEIDVKIVFFCV